MNLKGCINELKKIIFNSEPKRLKEDPLLFRDAPTVRQFYKGYPCIVQWTYGSPWYYVHIDEAEDWCKENCTGKFTNHIHRVISGPEFPNVEEDDWHFSDISGDDYCFWAFTEEKDAILFSLKW